MTATLLILLGSGIQSLDNLNQSPSIRRSKRRPDFPGLQPLSETSKGAQLYFDHNLFIWIWPIRHYMSSDKINLPWEAQTNDLLVKFKNTYINNWFLHHFIRYFSQDYLFNLNYLLFVSQRKWVCSIYINCANAALSSMVDNLQNGGHWLLYTAYKYYIVFLQQVVWQILFIIIVTLCIIRVELSF